MSGGTTETEARAYEERLTGAGMTVHNLLVKAMKARDSANKARDAFVKLRDIADEAEKDLRVAVDTALENIHPPD